MAWGKIDEEIIAYLTDELTPSEKEAFEQKLQTDLVLADAMNRHKNFESNLRSYGKYKQKKADINLLNQQFSKNQTSQYKSKRIKVLLSIAAIFILILIVWGVTENKKICPEELYANSFKVRIAPDIAGQGFDIVKVINNAHNHFNRSLFQKAESLYQQALDSKNLSINQLDEVHFYLGQSLMSQKKFEPAINSFQHITDGQYLQLTQWYIALSNLAMSQIEKAQSILLSISQDPLHDSQSEAKRLLKEWKRLKGCD